MDTHSLDLTTASDEALWRASRDGNLDAFGRIVNRYQSLICALAYSATGNKTASEDLAQDTFIAAWRQLSELREPTRLRAWLCGIARHLSSNAMRRTARRGGTPAALDEIAEPRSREADPEARAASSEEQALLWSALAQMPETYREPLVLFYREEQSLAAVAAHLDLSEDAVKQRLSRGRALLREEMASLVEFTLTRTKPGRAFTAAVFAKISALPSHTAIAASAAAGGKAAAGLSAGTLIGPVLGLSTAWTARKLAGMNARSPQERATITRQFRNGIAFALAMVVVLLALIYVGLTVFQESPGFIVAVSFAWTTALLFGFMRVNATMGREVAAIRLVTGTGDEAYAKQMASRHLTPAGPVVRTSSATLFGWPLFAFGSGGLDAGAGQTRYARGWIAIGDCAISPLLAIGGIAIAPVAIGGVTVGVVSLSLGGVAVGAIALGSVAAGWLAFGAAAIGWRAAGAAVVAHELAGATAVHAAAAFVPVTIVAVAVSIAVPLGLMGVRAWRLGRGPS